MPRKPSGEHVSLHGLTPEEALRALLAVKPEDEVGGEDNETDSGSPAGG